MIETIAPVKKATYSATIIPGKPRIRPITKASFTSPRPIPFPLVIKKSKEKNAKAPNAENT
ncbi:MAG: hypothetical protein CO135_03210 [Candidatus Levybacteria bacterium CG_4_9_14_3_um_filter_35_16]|nr:MAG: hypothetical protein COW87_00435 [Candidatus Levybacteria bacterium CG22_combo_CG10-13_8_21_14_all_35_11]PIY94633.1 MAG: hypothetical protein COY68_02015 [Candidatus Levybacteria bacterium CG_4_10_14_0_8_um_filter_35_23]PJA91081.1 MAG: hypothetical protein CO135_03210 [Candidatus Levybacteria bacterium CG_4_9_14_3_um_filter_35_16]PJC54352.1 MAG: hypothetical protein CO028_02910 [Candidatus Levybacteria bacterium CG_4_9_14_0_2_um_filter_35_21]